MDIRRSKAVPLKLASPSTFHKRVSSSRNKAELNVDLQSVVTLGKDRVGLMYTSQSVTLAADLAREVKKKLGRGLLDYKTADFQRSYSLALWAAHMIQT